MKILFLTQYCPPEVGAPQNRIFEFAKELKKLGHEVSILTAMPNYPKGRIFDGYKGKVILKEEIDGIPIIRTWIYATQKNSFIKRLLNYLSFTFSSVFLGAWKISKQDIIITESPPIFLGGSGYILAKLKKAKYIFNISDLWPESAIKLGVLKNRTLIRLSTWLEEFCYKKADLITGQTQGIVNNIIERGFDKSKIHLVTNGVNTALFNKDMYDDSFKIENDLADKFTVCYAGIHGLAQGLEVILETAKQLENYNEICFLFIGEGPEKEKLMGIAENEELKNVKFLPMQQKKEMPRIIASMDATIIPLKKIDLFKGALPSKMFEALASQLPIILAVEGEAKKLIEEANAGICVEPENSAEIAKAIITLYKDPDFAKALGKNGRDYVCKHYSRKAITDRLNDKLTALMKNEK